MMCYYKQRFGEKIFTVKYAIIGISEQTKHDGDLVIAFENRDLEILKSRTGNIKELHV